MKRSKTQMERLLDLHERLKNNRYPNCTGFAVDWEVSAKTAQRDFDFLRDRLGAPLEYDPARRGWYYTDPNFMLPAVSMSEGELIALLMGAKAMEQFKGTPVAEKLKCIFEKLSGQLPDPVSINPTELFSQFSFSAPPAMPIRTEIWNATVEALLSRKMMRIEYQNWKGTKTFRITPAHLANLQGDWYIFVQFEGFENFRQLALSRINTAEVLDRPAVISGTFDLHRELESTFSKFAGENSAFKVVLRFNAETAGLVLERQWHPNQKIRNLKNGELELSFQAKGDLEVMRWILAWGHGCKVISPAWLKDKLADEIGMMSENYS